MYLRAAHAEHHIPSLRRFIHDNPLGLLITAIQSPTFPTIQCTHIPWLLDVSDHASETDLGTLRGHLARANPHAKAMSEAAQMTSTSHLEQEVSIMFTSPVTHYVTPKFYIETKPSTGKVVPTWNYAAVQAYGTARIFWNSKDAETGSFLQKQISDLSQHAETNVMGYDGLEGRKAAWGVNDAPEKFIDLLKKSIVGIEVEVKSLEGKWKMSQELKDGDREGVVKGFEDLGTEDANVIARTVQGRGSLKPGG